MKSVQMPIHMFMELIHQLLDELKQQLIKEWTEELKQKEEAAD